MTGVRGRPDLPASADTSGEPANRTGKWPGASPARGGWLERLDDARTAALTASLLAVVLIVAAFGMVASRAVALDFHNRQTVWVVDAIPAVLSELYHGHQKRYTALESVRRRFFNRVDRDAATARQINAAMNRIAETADENPGTAYVLLGPDDKGIVDLVKGGFVLFGVRAESILTFYFALLLASCALYVVAYWRSPSALLLLAAFLAMFYLVMPMFMYNGQLRSVLALRVLPILSMVACLHCLLFMATSLHARVGVMQVLLVALQVLLIVFTIHLRSTTLWQVATILGFGIAVSLVPGVLRIVRAWRNPPPLTPHPHEEGGSRVLHRSVSEKEPGGMSGRRSALAIGAAVGLTIAGYVGLAAYHAIALPEEYRRGDEIATRVFWHNIFTGFAYHPTLRERFQIRLDDVSIMAATRDYLAETGRLDVWLEMGGKPPPATLADDTASSYESVKFAPYDSVVREMLISRCSTLVRECLETLLWYKPVSLLANLAWLYGFSDLPPDLDVTESRYFGSILKEQFLGMSQGMDANGLRAYLWAPQVLLIIVPFVVLFLVEPRWRIWAAFGACAGLTVGSTIPTVAGYAAPHTIAEAAIAAGMLVYLGLGITAAAVLRRALDR